MSAGADLKGTSEAADSAPGASLDGSRKGPSGTGDRVERPSADGGPTPGEASPPPDDGGPEGGATEARPPGSKEEGDLAGEAPLSPRAERALSGLPFLFGGGLALLLAYTLRTEPARAGTPPLWVLFLTLGLVALIAGVLLIISSEPEPGEDGDEEHVVVPRKEWTRVQRELRELRSAGPRAQGLTRAAEGHAPEAEMAPRTRTGGA